MIMRRAAVLSVALVLTACSTAVDGRGIAGSGGPATGSSTGSSNSGPVPCGSTSSSQAPNCTPPSSSSSSSSSSPSPTPSPTPSSTAGTLSALPASWKKFARTIYKTPFGDPAVLNVCRVADSISLSKYKLTLVPPSSTLGASCSLDFKGANVKGTSVVFTVSRSGPNVSPKPKRTTVSGQTVYAFPYDKGGSCLRQLVVNGGGIFTTVSVTIYGTLPGGRTTACGATDAMIAPFASIAAGKLTPPTIPTASPSLFALDACKVAAAAKISSAALAGGHDPGDTDYDTSCSWIGTNALFVSTGLLRNPSATPEGKPVTVGKHTLYKSSTNKYSCRYTSKQSGGETLEMYYSTSKAVSAAACSQSATLLGRYLDTLGLR